MEGKKETPVPPPCSLYHNSRLVFTMDTVSLLFFLFVNLFFSCSAHPYLFVSFHHCTFLFLSASLFIPLSPRSVILISVHLSFCPSLFLSCDRGGVGDVRWLSSCRFVLWCWLVPLGHWSTNAVRLCLWGSGCSLGRLFWVGHYSTCSVMYCWFGCCGGFHVSWCYMDPCVDRFGTARSTGPSGGSALICGPTFHRYGCVRAISFNPTQLVYGAWTLPGPQGGHCETRGCWGERSLWCFSFSRSALWWRNKRSG